MKKTFYTFAIHEKKNYMAIIKSALATGARGKFGNMRLSTQNNRIIGATQPGSYRDANTDVQKANRNGLKSLVWFSEFVSNAYKVGFAKYKGVQSEYNIFISRNKTASQESTDTQVLPVGYSNIVISDGPLSAMTVSGSSPSTGILSVSFINTLVMPKDELTDKVCYLVVKKLDDATAIEKIDYAQKEFFTATTTPRSNGTINVIIPPIITTGDDVAVYLFFNNTTTKECGPTTIIEFTAV